MIKHFNTAWLILVVLVLGYLALNPELLTRDSIAGVLNSLDSTAFFVYILMSLTRAALMLPGTPFILAGGVAFPDSIVAVWVVSQIGIIAGTVLVYSVPSFGAYDQFLEQRYPRQIALVREKMHGPYAFWIVIAWAFFPLVPTDVISYVAGVVRMSYIKLQTAIIIGEIPLVTLYIIAGAEFGEWLTL